MTARLTFRDAVSESDIDRGARLAARVASGAELRAELIAAGVIRPGSLPLLTPLLLSHGPVLRIDRVGRREVAAEVARIQARWLAHVERSRGPRAR